jgi:hypothetical protein
MSVRHLDTYLNDHLAASVGAIELLDYLASAYKDSAIGQFALDLHEEVSADQHELKAIMKGLNIGLSVPRRVSAWVAEKFAHVKLRFDDPQGGTFRLLEATEALSLGIEGKKTLWRTLSKIAETVGELKVLDYDKLIQRADEQRARVESVRLEAAQASLSNYS